MAERKLSEREAIAIITEMIGVPAPGVEVGPGDDAAIFSLAGGSVILTVDSMYEGVHFTLETSCMSDVGWKAMASSISDIAAMGGQPACALVSLALAEPPGEVELRGLVGGAIEAADLYHCPIVGGDLCRSASGLSLSVTVVGCPHPSGPVLRGGARVGDIIGVTGTLGDSAAGLYVLSASTHELRARFAGLVEAHLRPRPKLRAGQVLASLGVNAMEDVSDGLAADLSNICTESATGCEVRAEDIPLDREIIALAAEMCYDPLDWALGGGEDYELIFTAPPGLFDEAVAALGAHGTGASRIGTMTLASSGMRLITGHGNSTDLKGHGYDHFL